MLVQFDPTAFLADPELILELEKRAVPVNCGDGCILFEQGETAIGLYILRNGKATMSINSEGQTVIQVEIGPGSLIGLPGLMGGQPYSMNAIAHKGSKVLFVSREDFAAIMTANPDLSFKILKILAAEVHTARRALYE